MHQSLGQCQAADNPVLWFTWGVLQLLQLTKDPGAWGMPVSCPLCSAPHSQHHFSVFFHFSPALAAREKTPCKKDVQGQARFCFLTQALLMPRMLCLLLALGALALSLAGERGWDDGL